MVGEETLPVQRDLARTKRPRRYKETSPVQSLWFTVIEGRHLRRSRFISRHCVAAQSVRVGVSNVVGEGTSPVQRDLAGTKRPRRYKETSPVQSLWFTVIERQNL